jgi:hypothetical protein
MAVHGFGLLDLSAAEMKKPARGGLRFGCRTTLLKKSIYLWDFGVKFNLNPREIQLQKCPHTLFSLLLSRTPSGVVYWIFVQYADAQNRNRQTPRRIRAIHARPNMRVLPAGTAYNATPTGKAMRVGCEARGCGAPDALLDLRSEEVVAPLPYR